MAQTYNKRMEKLFIARALSVKKAKMAHKYIQVSEK